MSFAAHIVNGTGVYSNPQISCARFFDTPYQNPPPPSPLPASLQQSPRRTQSVSDDDTQSTSSIVALPQQSSSLSCLLDQRVPQEAQETIRLRNCFRHIEASSEEEARQDFDRPSRRNNGEAQGESHQTLHGRRTIDPQFVPALRVNGYLLPRRGVSTTLPQRRSRQHPTSPSYGEMVFYGCGKENRLRSLESTQNINNSRHCINRILIIKLLLSTLIVNVTLIVNESGNRKKHLCAAHRLTQGIPGVSCPPSTGKFTYRARHTKSRAWNVVTER